MLFMIPWAVKSRSCLGPTRNLAEQIRRGLDSINVERQGCVLKRFERSEAIERWNGASAWMLRAARLNLHLWMFWDWTMGRIESCNGKVVCRSLPLFHFLV